MSAGVLRAMPQGWLEPLLRLRDRMVARPDFRRWAAAFPLTRPIARRRAAALFDLSAGFVYAQILLACVRLDLFALLAAEGPQSAASLGARLALPPDGCARLLDSAVALRLLACRGGRFSLGPLGAALVENPAVLGMIAHHPMLYRDLADPLALLRGERGETELARYWPYGDAGTRAGLAGADVAPYSALMSASQTLIADEVLAAVPLAGYRCLLDVGGGEGGFLAAALSRTPGLRGIVFDLPPVAALAQARFTAQGLPARAVGGDFATDPLPQGADLVSLVRVLHDHDDAVALALLRAVRAALPQGGTLLLAEPMATRGAESVGAYFNFYLLAMGHGRPRSPAAIGEMLRATGFSRIRHVATHTPLLTSVLLARAA